MHSSQNSVPLAFRVSKSWDMIRESIQDISKQAMAYRSGNVKSKDLKKFC